MDYVFADLGHQTVQRIVHAFDPLQSMQEINQNFPSIVSSLSRMKVKYDNFWLVVFLMMITWSVDSHAEV